MHISYKPLWHTLLERDMRKEDLRLSDCLPPTAYVRALLTLSLHLLRFLV